jgi:hypothetical protein
MATSWGGGNSKESIARLEAQQRVVDRFGRGADNCVNTDKNIKIISDALVAERKKYPLPNLAQRYYIEAMESRKMIWENTFSRQGCRDILENIRLNDAGLNETKFAIRAEQQILPKNEQDVSLYIGLGAVVMLVGLYVILK